LNYRHAYHAGNFADLVKHAVLGAVLDRMLREPGPLTVIDTHAGAGLYELDAPAALASGEAQAGIGRLMADAEAPPALEALKAAVRRLNPKGGHRLYPGSPRLIADRMRPTDRLVACELRPDDAAHLRRALAGAKAEVLTEDGYAVLATRAAPGRLLALIDPPFERADDYARAAEAAKAALRRNPAAVILIWTPLKDLETFDGFLRRLEAGGAPSALVIEARLRPLDDPMKMNGCALVVINPPTGIETTASEGCAWVVRACGEPGGADRVWRLGGG
jgi:23S rRNA (adenine2030-N6)-methyltransferase